jgi:hypothetical protein
MKIVNAKLVNATPRSKKFKYFTGSIQSANKVYSASQPDIAEITETT